MHENTCLCRIYCRGTQIPLGLSSPLPCFQRRNLRLPNLQRTWHLRHLHAEEQPAHLMCDAGMLFGRTYRQTELRPPLPSSLAAYLLACF